MDHFSEPDSLKILLRVARSCLGKPRNSLADRNAAEDHPARKPCGANTKIGLKRFDAEPHYSKAVRERRLDENLSSESDSIGGA